MERKIHEAFKDFGGELLETIREDMQGRLDDAAFHERIIGIRNATEAMMEVGVEDDKIIQMLQKYWDLRLSEAKSFVKRQHEFNMRNG